VDENEVYEECPICGGSGLVAWDAGFRYPCVNCDGSGLVPHECEFDYEIEDGR
jgi:DnaJ-class molecular chaperone